MLDKPSLTNKDITTKKCKTIFALGDVENASLINYQPILGPHLPTFSGGPKKEHWLNMG